MAAQRLLKAAEARGFEGDKITVTALKKACSGKDARTVVERLADLLEQHVEGSFAHSAQSTPVSCCLYGGKAAL